MSNQSYDALLFVSFGGPESPDDVIPFLENVLRGKNVPRERMLEVAEHYNHFGGVSPINQQCRDLIAAIETELQQHNVDLPVYWGNRNWEPMLPDTMRELKQAGAKRVLAFVTSGFSSYSGCRQYREDVYRAQAEANAGEIEVHKIRVFYNHPDFIDVISQNVDTAIQQVSNGDISDLHIAFTAHSIPMAMAKTSDYEKQLQETCRLVTEQLSIPQERWKLVYQSRSGRPQDPWLEPDICDYIGELNTVGVKKLVVSPVGFLSDHMEVLFDLDDEAQKACEGFNIAMSRAATPGIHPQFVSMIRKLIQERMDTAVPECIGSFPANHDECPVDCCPAPKRPPAARS